MCKNKLQEYCQKNNLEMPSYKSSSKGSSHKPLWFSSVTVNFTGKNVTVDSHTPSNSKICAETMAANKMLSYISCNFYKNSTINRLYNTATASTASTASTSNVLVDTSINSPASTANAFVSNPIKETINKIYLIDLENKPFPKNKADDSESIYIGFINSIHHSVINYKQWHNCETDNISSEISFSKNTKLLYTVDGGTKDMVDHFMSFFCYAVVNYIYADLFDKNLKIIIVSGDHSGWCTRTCLETILRWKSLSKVSIVNSVCFN